MKRWTAVALSLSMALAFSPQLPAKGGNGQGSNAGHAQGGSPTLAHNSNSNGQRSSDRDFGKDRALEVGHGKKKGLHKNHHSNVVGHDKKKDKH